MTEELDRVRYAELARTPSERLREQAVAGHSKTPTRLARAQAGDHVRHRQGVLLRIEPPDPEEAEFVGPRSRERRLGRDDLVGADERDAGGEDGRSVAAAVTPGKFVPDNNRGSAASRAPELQLEPVGG